MERLRNRDRLLVPIVATALAIGALSVALATSPDQRPAKNQQATFSETFTLPDGTRCVDSVYESSQDIPLGGGCAESTYASNDAAVSNSYVGGPSNTIGSLGLLYNDSPAATVPINPSTSFSNQ